MSRLRANLPYAPVQRRLDEWTGPTLVMWGDPDPFLPTEQGHRTATAPGTTLRLLAGAGHFLSQERPARSRPQCGL